MLSIGEILFPSCDQMVKLNKWLNQVCHKLCNNRTILSPNMIFGVYSTIFWEDVCRIVKARENQLLNPNSNLWENLRNVVIILNSTINSKMTLFSEVVKRMWDGNFTKQVCMVKTFSCQMSIMMLTCICLLKYSERVSTYIHQPFKHKLRTFHLQKVVMKVVLEAGVRKAPRHKQKEKNTENGPFLLWSIGITKQDL